MKKLAMSLVFICALAVVGSAQTTQKTSNVAQPASRHKVVTKTNTSSSTAQANKPKTAGTTMQKTTMMRPKHKHQKHTAKQKISK
jgi:hypothetical protein